ncbi:MAG TPA: VWA domain-containing protein [Gammaproteobacteria bacterium]|nr:VWA domain-containing protein [Gammaproteobacteria bacterium]
MWRILVLSACLVLTGCSEGAASSNRGLYMLIDTSGTYTQELDKAQQIISYALTRMESGDAFAVARIDTASFTEKNIVAKVTFDDRPSAANQQKRAFQEAVAAFVKDTRSSAHTDITGGVLQAVEFLREQPVGRRTVLIFSDMEEDLARGYVRDIPLSLDGVEVIAVNVTKLRSDNVDPRKYMSRLDEWKQRVEAGGGKFRVINDLDRLEAIFQ